VLRLASLLWRLRRIISIETDLLRFQSEIVRERRAALDDRPSALGRDSSSIVFELKQEEESNGECELVNAEPMSIRDLTCCFMRLGNPGNGVFERLGRYNAVLWKQTANVVFAARDPAILMTTR
jgi:hypothetical protein